MPRMMAGGGRQSHVGMMGRGFVSLVVWCLLIHCDCEAGKGKGVEEMGSSRNEGVDDGKVSLSIIMATNRPGVYDIVLRESSTTLKGFSPLAWSVG